MVIVKLFTSEHDILLIHVGVEVHYNPIHQVEFYLLRLQLLGLVHISHYCQFYWIIPDILKLYLMEKYVLCISTE